LAPLARRPVDERLARHYGIPDIVGTEFRKATYADARRRGLLAHGSILTLTSHADRTSPVLRGKWVMEVLLGTPPPPPPPNVPALDDNDGDMATVGTLPPDFSPTPLATQKLRAARPAISNRLWIALALSMGIVCGLIGLLVALLQ